ncbi:SDR family oxidoreductase [uncultured Roseibium sp.]|uniref:SDR family oxidoreductase n=1 Tax=uncultured Roseibium sp. TaxID=1936171 RepID=UPI003217AA88
MIALTGANGQLGRLVIEHLNKAGASGIRALVRSPEKAQDLVSSTVSVVQADYDKPDTLTAALSGVDKLLLISSSEIGQRTRQHKAVIDAARDAGVSFIAYTSILNADTSPMILAKEHRDTEAALKASGIPHVLLRNGWYLENYAGTVAAALEHGAVVGSAGNGRISAATRSDYAAAAATVLAGNDTSMRTYELAGSSAFTLADMAGEISTQTGREIPFNNLPADAYAGILVQAGLPQAFADILADSDTAAAGGALYSESPDLENLIGHPTESMKDFVQTQVG